MGLGSRVKYHCARQDGMVALGKQLQPYVASKPLGRFYLENLLEPQIPFLSYASQSA